MIDKLGKLAEQVATRLTRRGFLGRVAAWAAGAAAVLTGSVATAAVVKKCLFKVIQSNCGQVPPGSILCLPCKFPIATNGKCKEVTMCVIGTPQGRCKVTVQLISVPCEVCPAGGIKSFNFVCS
jgi:hypothetical protein